ncbi:unnamed protein product, partial [Adineta steineri]
MIDEEMARIIPVLKSPQLTDILPIKFAFSLINHQFFIPHIKHLLSAIIHNRRQCSSTESISSNNDDEDNDSNLTTKKSPVIRINDIVPEMATNTNAPIVSYLTPTSSSFEDNQ